MHVKEHARNKKGYVAIAFALGAFFFGYQGAHAATLSINSSAATLSPGNIATLSVVLNADGISVNNAEARIIFPTDLLEVVSVSKGGSILSLWIEEPAYSNLSGAITFNGGIPTNGFLGSNGVVASFVVRAKRAGRADVLFADAAVRANDGLGTDVLTNKLGKTLSILDDEPTVVDTKVPEPAPSSVTLQVTSPTHPSQESWYKDSSPIFRWSLSSGVDAVQTGIDDNPSGAPRVTFSPAISERTVKDLKDGIWHFKVRARKSGAWGPVSTYIARVDTTAPQKNQVVFSYDDVKKLLDIKADIIDVTSGLKSYQIFINDSLIQEVPAEKFIDGNYTLAVDTPGNNLVKLVAVDRAGNTVESTGDFMTTAVKPVTQGVVVVKKPLMVTIGSFAIPVGYGITTLLLAVAILIFGAFKLGRHYGRLRNKLRLHSLAKSDDKKVLLLLKKHLDKHLEILRNIRESRILSKEEKEIKEAIESDLDEIDRAVGGQGK